MNPIARKDKLTIRELPDETLIYDLERHKMHCLNRTAALVWKHCDGRRDPAALAAVLGRQLLLSADEAAAAARLALEQLGRRHLLTEAVAPTEDEDRITRRAVLRKIAKAAAVAAALPLVMTLKSPSIAWAQNPSTCTPGQANTCPQGFTCNIVAAATDLPYGPHNSKQKPGEPVYGCVNNVTGGQLQTTTTTTTTKGPCVANGGACTGTNGTQGNCCAGLCLGGFCSA